jgi:hypothetical protein
MSKSYDVGYRKPPQHTQFQKGRSGNPKGRPKGSKNLMTELIEELKETIVIREGGVAKRVSKGRAMIKRQVLLGLEGDAKALTCVFGLTRSLAQEQEEPESAVSPDDLAILERYVARRGGKP